jgi:hypothetical protein
MPVALEYSTHQPLHKSYSLPLLLALIISGAALGVYSFAVFYDIADKEPFYGYSPAELRTMMLIPIVQTVSWAIWCLVLIALIFTRKIHPHGAFLLLWAVVWILAAVSGINQYRSDISVLKSPNRDWIIEHGKSSLPH